MPVVWLSAWLGTWPLCHCQAPADSEPYGHAPYAWISVKACNTHTGWCKGTSQGGFALRQTDSLEGKRDDCTHYCPGQISALWRDTRGRSPDLTRYQMEGVMLGAYVKKLDRSSCIPIPGGFSCTEQVFATVPLNRVSVMLHATPRNKAYYFGTNSSGDCDPGPQCSAYKLMKRTLHAPEASRLWPDTDDVLAIRNSPYACVLAYVGLGDAEAIGLCHLQLGDMCFKSNGNEFCVSGSRHVRPGLTNWDSLASAPLAMCEISGGDHEKTNRSPEYSPTPEEIRDFVAPSMCDATVVPVERVRYSSNGGYLALALDAALFATVAQAGYVIAKIPFDECVVPVSPNRAEFSTVLESVAETLAKASLSVSSTALLLDASRWGLTDCSKKNWRRDQFGRVANLIVSALLRRGVHKVFLGLPRSQKLLENTSFSDLDEFEAFVTPRGHADAKDPAYCQNTWVSTNGQKSGTDDGDDDRYAVVPYLMTLLRRGVRANKIVFTLSLTGVLKLSGLEGTDEPSGKWEVTGSLPLADLETNTVLKCEEDLNTKCCSGSSATVWARGVMVNVTVTSTSFETLKQFPELVAVAFGVNQFVIAPVDSDFKRGVRSETPAILGIASAVHRLRDWKRQQMAAGISTTEATATLPSSRAKPSRFARSATAGLHPSLPSPIELLELDDVVINVPENMYKDPASGSKSSLDPQYNVGLSHTLVCPGLVAVHGALGVFKEPHRELYATSYDRIYIGNVYAMESCTPGEPDKMVESSDRPPQVAININTMVPTMDRNHYMVGILDTNRFVEYAPPVSKVCAAHNTGESTQSLNLVFVDDGYAVNMPVVEPDHGVIVKAAEALHFVSNFTPGLDYINLNVSCVNYDVSALKPCLISVCGGDDSCRRDYGKLCDSAHEITNDARRAGDLMREGLEELAVQERKASAYALPDKAPFPALDRLEGRHSRRKRFVGIALGGAALGLAIHVSQRVDHLEVQMDSMKNSFTKVSGQLVEVSNRLDTNVALIDGRIDEQERKMKRNTEIANKNFGLLRDAMKRNTEAALRDTNVKFSVMASYQMWYAQMQSVTHQMTQAAMHTKFMARGVENCLRQIASKRSGSCPSGMTVMREHPGLSEFPTVGAALYKDRKLFIVHSVPNTVERAVVRGIIPMPKMSSDGIPCWPDYEVWLIDGRFYEPSECYGKYCRKPELHERYRRCVEDPAECKTVCGECHRSICYRDMKVTWMEGSATVEIESPPLKPFSRPHISDGPVSFADLLKDSLPGAPELELLEVINTSVNLLSVSENLHNVTRDLRDFETKYDELTAGRVSFGGWLSGLANSAALWVSIGLLTTWCGALSAGIAYLVFCSGAGGGGGPALSRPIKRRRTKML